jgi:pimeloyl-ACP methyl ester carboxylesterase
MSEGTDNLHAPRRNTRRSVALAVTAVLVLTALFGSRAHANKSPSHEPAFAAVGSPRTFQSTAGVYEFVFAAARGATPFDHIALHRITPGPVAPSTPGVTQIAPVVSFVSRPRVVMLYLPGTNMNGQVAIDNTQYSLPLYFAAHGVDAWALDYRTHFVPPSTPQAALTELTSWTNELFESDIDAAVSFIVKTTGRDRIFVAGFSRGVNFAYLYAAAHPARVAGLVLFDGWIGHGRPGAPPIGVYADDVGGKHLTWDKREALLKLVIANPGAPAPIAKYKSASDNLNHVVYDSAGFGGKGGLSNPFGGFSDPSVLAQVLIQYDRYWPTVQDYEDSFGAGAAASLARSKIPVLAFSSSNIAPDWPQNVAKSAASTGSKDITVKALNGWGHLDVICGTHAEAEVFAPAVAWLKRHQK